MACMQPSSSQQAIRQRIAVWHPDLIAIGYNEPLPVPISAVQATLAAIQPSEIHAYVRASDLAAQASATAADGGEPLLLITLDLGQWTRIFEYANVDAPKAIERLKELKGCLCMMVNKDNEDFEWAETHTPLVEETHTPLGSEFHDITEQNKPPTNTKDDTTLNHPFLRNLQVSEAHKAALEDLQENISLSQVAIDRGANFATGKKLAIPLMPARSVEDMMPSVNHRVWLNGNINLLAPIPFHLWRIWAGLTSEEMKLCAENAKSNTHFISNAYTMPSGFPLSSYEYTKCPTHVVRVHIKQDMSPLERTWKFPNELWNCARPYLRFVCHKMAVSGCSGAIIWFDHAVWFIVNHLERFFPDNTYPSLVSKFGAFLIWLAGAGRLATKCHIFFMHSRGWLVDGAIKLTADLNARLFPNIPEHAGLIKVERLLLPIEFSLKNPLIPTEAPAGKRQKLNMNAGPAKEGGGGFRHSRGRGRGRGNYHNNSRNSNSGGWNNFGQAHNKYTGGNPGNVYNNSGGYTGGGNNSRNQQGNYAATFHQQNLHAANLASPVATQMRVEPGANAAPMHGQRTIMGMFGTTTNTVTSNVAARATITELPPSVPKRHMFSFEDEM